MSSIDQPTLEDDGSSTRSRRQSRSQHIHTPRSSSSASSFGDDYLREYKIEQIIVDELAEADHLYEYYNSINNPTEDISKLNFFQNVKLLCARIYLLVDSETSSTAAFYVSIFLKLAIVLSVFSYIAQVEPSLVHEPSSCSNPACNDDPDICPGTMICEGQPAQAFVIIDLVCIIVFTVEYGLRFCTAWAVSPRIAGILPLDWDRHHKPSHPLPEYSVPLHMTKWFFSVRNLIDLACFLPYYVLISLNENSSSEFIRILRILRVFRALRMIHFVTFAKHAMVMYELVLTTFQRSAPVLVVFLFFSLLAMVFFSCLIFAFEQGKFTVNSDYPSGAYLRPTINQASKEISPYTSISASMYWAVVTGTTTGYGDIAPTSAVGRAITVIMVFLGVFSIALPVGVLGANFTREYNAHFKKVAKKLALKQKQVREESRHAIGRRQPIPSGRPATPLTVINNPDLKPGDQKTGQQPVEKPGKESESEPLGPELSPPPGPRSSTPAPKKGRELSKEAKHLIKKMIRLRDSLSTAITEIAGQVEDVKKVIEEALPDLIEEVVTMDDDLHEDESGKVKGFLGSQVHLPTMPAMPSLPMADSISAAHRSSMARLDRLLSKRPAKKAPNTNTTTDSGIVHDDSDKNSAIHASRTASMDAIRTAAWTQKLGFSNAKASTADAVQVPHKNRSDILDIFRSKRETATTAAAATHQQSRSEYVADVESDRMSQNSIGILIPPPEFSSEFSDEEETLGVPAQPRPSILKASLEELLRSPIADGSGSEHSYPSVEKNSNSLVGASESDRPLSFPHPLTENLRLELPSHQQHQQHHRPSSPAASLSHSLSLPLPLPLSSHHRHHDHNNNGSFGTHEHTAEHASTQARGQSRTVSIQEMPSNPTKVLVVVAEDDADSDVDDVIRATRS